MSALRQGLAWLRGLRLSRLERAAYALVVVWALAMISVPIQRWTLGDSALPFGVTLGALLQAAAAVLVLAAGLGARRALIVAAVTVVAAWVIEFIGSSTGFPFGPYHYTDKLQPQIGGVPLLVPVAWMMLMPSAWALAALLTRGRSRAAFVLASMLIFTAWDLFLDPQMVGWGFWQFDHTTGFTYFGIPWTNYGGWLLSSAVISALALVAGLRPERIPVVPALVIYAVVWFLQTVGLVVFWGLPGPGIVGTIAMGIPMVLAARRVWAGRSRDAAQAGAPPNRP